MTSDKKTQTEDQEQVSGNKDAPSKKSLFAKIKGNKKLLIAIIIGIIVILGLVGFIFYKSSIAHPKKDQVEKEVTKSEVDKPKEPENPIFFDLDEFIVNLDKGSNKQPSFLKLSVTLQLSSTSIVEKVKTMMPLIRDSFQVYLRELRAQDLQGSEAVYRLRDELLLRLNYIFVPNKIDDILFREILVQ